MTCIQADGVEIEVDPTALNVKRIEVHHHDNHTGEVVRSLAVANQCGIICVVKTQVAVALKRRSLSADAVQPGNETLEACVGVLIPVLELILFRVEVFFAARL